MEKCQLLRTVSLFLQEIFYIVLNIMHCWRAMDFRVCLEPKYHGQSISAHSYEFYHYLAQLDNLDFTLSHKHLQGIWHSCAMTTTKTATKLSGHHISFKTQLPTPHLVLWMKLRVGRGWSWVKLGENFSLSLPPWVWLGLDWVVQYIDSFGLAHPH